MKCIIWTTGLWMSLNGFSIAFAQSLPNPIERSQPSIPTNQPELPQAQEPPILPPISPQTAPTTESQVAFPIRTIEVLGNTVLDAEIKQLTQTFLEQHPETTTLGDLVSLRTAITNLYIQNGYITSGAFIPSNQRLTDGNVRIQIVEGEIETIDIRGLRSLNPSYVKNQLTAAVQPPLNRQKLEQSLQKLQLDPLIRKVDANLSPGVTSGRSQLQLNLQEAPPFQTSFRINNHQSSTIGALQGTVSASYNDLLGLGDRFNAEYGRTSGLSLYSLQYAVPLNAQKTTLSVRYSNFNSKIIEEPLNDLDIRSRSNTLSFDLQQPIVRTPSTEFTLGLGLDLRRSRTFILNDRPFSFSEGPQNGQSRTSVLNFSQDWLQRRSRQVIAARSQFNFGLNALGATENATAPDGQFFSWVGQAQWVKQWSPRILTIARLDAQLTSDRLLSLEKFSLGGANTLRGYSQNQLVTDNGIATSLEIRLPIGSGDRQVWQVMPFFDAGIGWNNQANEKAQWLMGTGLGLQWQASPRVSFRVDYGIPLVQPAGDRNTPRLYFSAQYSP
jgi:hemolysin activation/secretion protein